MVQFDKTNLTFDFAEPSLEHVVALAAVALLAGLGLALGVVLALVVSAWVALRLFILKVKAQI
jgi:hypothetical protein